MSSEIYKKDMCDNCSAVQTIDYIRKICVIVSLACRL